MVGLKVKKMDELFKDLDVYRTQEEMKQYFEHTQQMIHQNREYIKLARLKKGRFKKFFEEFYPLYCFSQSSYCPRNSKLKLIIGSQGYDGLILQPDGTEKRIEITSYKDGKLEFEDAQRVNSGNFALPRIQTEGSVEEYIEKVLENIQKKSKKDYSGASILFVVHTFHYFEAYGKSSAAFIRTLKKEMKNTDFRADKIYLLELNQPESESVKQNIHFIK